MYIYIYMSICECNWEIVFLSFVHACVPAGGRGAGKLCALERRCCFQGCVAGGQFVLRLGVLRVADPLLGHAMSFLVCQVCSMNPSMRLVDER